MFGGFFFGQQFYGEVQIVETVVAPVVPPTTGAGGKGAGPLAGGRFKSRDEAWRDQEALAIAADDAELLSLVGLIIEEIETQ